MEWLKLVLPLVAPVAIGIASAAFGQLLLTSRRLRDDVAADTELLERLPVDVRRELDEEIRDRAYLLVAYTRYPGLTGPEILTLTAVLMLAAAGIAIVWDEHHAVAADNYPNLYPLVYSGLVILGIAAAWDFYLKSWVPRTMGRVAYILWHLGGQTAADSVRVVRVQVVVMMLGVLACILATPWDVLFVSKLYQLDDAWFGAAIGALAVVVLLFFVVPNRRARALTSGTISGLVLALAAERIATGQALAARLRGLSVRAAGDLIRAEGFTSEVIWPGFEEAYDAPQKGSGRVTSVPNRIRVWVDDSGAVREAKAG
jgi:hypothetical protein